MGTNLFKHYSQKENRFTNGLISLVELSNIYNTEFFNDFFGLIRHNEVSNNFDFKVLNDIKGTSDAELSDKNSVFLIETKIESGALREDQIRNHLKKLKEYNQKK